MVKIIKEELSFEESSKKKIEFIYDFCNTKPTFINESIRNIDKTYLTYIEQHRIIINNITFIAFNYSNEIIIELGDKVYWDTKYFEFKSKMFEVYKSKFMIWNY